MSDQIKDALTAMIRSASNDVVLGVGSGRALVETMLAAQLSGMTDDEIAAAVLEGGKL